MLTSARTGEGVDEWREWLAGGARTAPRRRPDRAGGRGRHGDRGRARGPGRRAARARGRTPTRASSSREAERLARCCHRMAERFARGGRLVALGRSPAARSDARHVAVEFVHPVIVGKRALPAIGLAAEGGPLGRAGRRGRRARRHRDRASRPTSRRREPREALAAGARAGLPDDRLRRRAAPSGSSSRRRRRPVRAPGAGRDALPRALGAGARLLRPPRPARGPRGARRSTTRGASSFLYPFLSEAEHDLDAVLDDVRALGADEVGGGRRAARADARPRTATTLVAAAATLRARLDAGGRLLACGNGGSATDAMDLVADLRAAARRGWPTRPGDRPDRGRLDPDRDRQRRRRRARSSSAR